MEASITAFCQSLASFCRHVEDSSHALSDSIHRRPIPLDSASAAFLHRLQRRISAAAADLDLLDSMALGTVSFPELLGHCHEVYKVNHAHLSALRQHLSAFGYVDPDDDDDDEESEEIGGDAEPELPINGSDETPFGCGSGRRVLEEDRLFEDSISLQNLGLSDACLATLASGENEESSVMSSPSAMSQADREALSTSLEDAFDTKGVNVARTIIEVSKDDYDNLPSYIKSLATWEELVEAASKMNSYLCMKGRAQGTHVFSQDDLETLGLGRKGRSFLLLLLKMNRLVVETVDGSNLYRVHAECS